MISIVNRESSRVDSCRFDLGSLRSVNEDFRVKRFEGGSGEVTESRAGWEREGESREGKGKEGTEEEEEEEVSFHLPSFESASLPLLGRRFSEGTERRIHSPFSNARNEVEAAISMTLLARRSFVGRLRSRES